MRGKLLRSMGGSKFSVMLCDTRAIVNVECRIDNHGVLLQMSKASAMKPLDVEVSLGDYDVDKALFGDSAITLCVAPTAKTLTTQYKRVAPRCEKKK